MTQSIENKGPRQFLIAHLSRKLAARAEVSIGRYQRCGGRILLAEGARRTSPGRKSVGLLAPTGEQRVRPHHGIKRLGMLGKGLTVLQVLHPSRRCTSRRMAASKSLGSKLLPRRSSGVKVSSSLLPLRLVGQRTLSRPRLVVPSRRLLARSRSTSQLLSRKMPRGPFQTNLAGLGWSGSSEFINLLVVHFVPSAGSHCPSLQNQGPQPAGKTADGPNSFLLRPTAFRYLWAQRSGGYALRGLNDESTLLFNDLRLEDFLAFFGAITVLLCKPALQGHSAIRRPNVSSPAKAARDRRPWTYAAENLLPSAVEGAPLLNYSTYVEFLTIISAAVVQAPSPASVHTPLQAAVTPRLAASMRQQIPIHSSFNTCHFSLRLPDPADSAKVNTMASLIQEVGETFFTLYKGFSVTLRTMFRKTTTESFPDAPPTVQPRYRGIHVLQRDEHGYEKCVGCFLCAAACPANCIYIEAAENTAANRISAGERYAKTYNIDYSRCIFCGYCVEACPTDAITHGHSIELAPYNINALIYRKEQLLEPWPPRAKQ